MTLLRRVRELDQRAYTWYAGTPTPRLDLVLPRLTKAADHGELWLGVAVGLAVIPGGPRRAALRGVAALSLASALANGPAKALVRRERPVLDLVPVVRHLARQPVSSSFPSGHAASAVAFCTGVALEYPPAGLPLSLLALGVAWGRVHTGVHYPGDVLAGVGVGVGAALLVRRVWPLVEEWAEAKRVSGTVGGGSHHGEHE